MTSRIIRTGFIAAALLTAPLAAQAADLRQPYKAPAYVAPAYANWNGFYIGLNAGYGFGKSVWDFPTVSTTPKGFLGGGTIGYNFQTGVWVWGIEGDFDISTMKDSSSGGGPVSFETKNSWLATGRGRFGYAGWNNWLPYLTAGAAYGEIKATNSATGNASKDKLGWTAGVGVEYALWTNWSAKLEYLYVDLGKFDCGVACGAPTDNVSFHANIGRVGVNYRF
jgi:outer membrane immunogenic protein